MLTVIGKAGQSRIIIVCLLLFAPAFGYAQKHTADENETGECRANQLNSTALPSGFNTLFAGSGECQLCHNSMTDSEGFPIGILNDWRSSMMANASKDPLWRAKLSHETLVNPSHAQILEDVCTRCHAPLGHFEAHHLGQQYYSIAEMTNDSLALDGVSCTLCHQIKSETFGNYSGNLLIGDAKQIYGPYEDPFPNPMINHTGYTPVFGSHVKNSSLCGSCHTLITNTVDLEGNLTGASFVEQAIYHEWKNSGFSESEVTCQTCHVPEISDTIKISTMPPWLDGRSPFGLHHLLGANVFMLRVLKDNIDELGITAEGAHLDSTISRTLTLLQQNTLNISVTGEERNDQHLSFDVLLENRAGHKFPSGFPSRRVFVKILVVNENNDTVFHSGAWDANFNIIGEDEGYEPHHETIDADSRVQIYEMVMGDVEGAVTTVLERGAVHLKDNRIPPQGFTSDHVSYDTVEISGLALDDPNFNIAAGAEGTGSDILHVKAPVSEADGTLEVAVQVFYQTVSSRWLEEMFSFESDEINTWKSLYNDADKTPVLVNATSFTSLPVGTFDFKPDPTIIYPNPTRGTLMVENQNLDLKSIEIYTMQGEKVISVEPFKPKASLDVSGQKGTILVKITKKDGGSLYRKVVVQ
jgi:hypothetical protein